MGGSPTDEASDDGHVERQEGGASEGHDEQKEARHSDDPGTPAFACTGAAGTLHHSCSRGGRGCEFVKRRREEGKMRGREAEKEVKARKDRRQS